MIEKKPFVPYKTEEEREKDAGKVFTIRLNNEELEKFNNEIWSSKKIKEFFGYSIKTRIKDLAIKKHFKYIGKENKIELFRVKRK